MSVLKGRTWGHGISRLDSGYVLYYLASYLSKKIQTRVQSENHQDKTNAQDY